MQKSIAIIGGGSAALMLASHLDSNKFSVSIFEKNNALGRKFLVAGDGGFNLTHSEKIEDFILKYTPSSFLEDSLKQFPNVALRHYLKEIGIETYIGSSKRVFPLKGIKPIDVLNAFLNQLKKNKTQIFTKHIWKGWNNKNELLFDYNNELKIIKTDIVIFAMGGASWSVTGSDGIWSKYFQSKGIKINPFQASNCAYQINWNSEFINFAEGKALKNIAVLCDNKIKSGELVFTRFGLEGGAIYAFSTEIRQQLNKTNSAEIAIDLKPSFSLEKILKSIQNKGNKSITKILKDDIKLSAIALELLKSKLSKAEFKNSELLSKKIKSLPFQIIDFAPIDEAISTVGGVSLTELDDNFQLKKHPNNYAVGEMLDWDAPTGGYLLQACFSMGYGLAKHLNTTIL